MFTTFESETICLLYLLDICFNQIEIFKPATSKEGNSEVYVICLDFQSSDWLQNFLKETKVFYFLKIQCVLVNINIQRRLEQGTFELDTQSRKLNPDIHTGQFRFEDQGLITSIQLSLQGTITLRISTTGFINLWINKRSRSSIDLDIHNSNVSSSGIISIMHED